MNRRLCEIHTSHATAYMAPQKGPVRATGWFHEFSVDHCEDGTYAVAIVELDDGTIVLPSADTVRFVSK